MTKTEFLNKLRENLSGLSQEDIEERITFYGEMIDDRMEEGLSEEEAVEGIGDLSEIRSQIVSSSTLTDSSNFVSEDKKLSKYRKPLLIALKSVFWIPLLSVVLALFVSIWAVVISLWATFGAICGCSLGGMVLGVALIIRANLPFGIAMIGASLVCAGLAIFAFFGCKALTKATVTLTKWIIRKFSKKEEA